MEIKIACSWQLKKIQSENVISQMSQTIINQYAMAEAVNVMKYFLTKIKLIKSYTKEGMEYMWLG